MDTWLKNGMWYAEYYLTPDNDITKSLKTILNKTHVKYNKYIILEKDKRKREIEKKKQLIIRLQKDQNNPNALRELQSLYPGLVPVK